MRIRVIILLFLLVGVFFIVSNNDLHLNETKDMQKFVSLFYSWLSGLFNNMKDITGYVIKANWLPQGNPVAVNVSG
jgi:hypothetical protein